MVFMEVLQKWNAEIHGNLPNGSDELNGKFLLLDRVSEEEYNRRDFGVYGPKIESGECILCLAESEEITIEDLVYVVGVPQMIFNPISLGNRGPDP